MKLNRKKAYLKIDIYEDDGSESTESIEILKISTVKYAELVPLLESFEKNPHDIIGMREFLVEFFIAADDRDKFVGYFNEFAPEETRECFEEIVKLARGAAATEEEKKTDATDGSTESSAPAEE